MFVTPAPVSLLIVVLEFVELTVLVMGLFSPRTVSLILMIVPFMIVIVLFVVIARTLAIVSEHRCRREYDRDHKGGTKQSRIQKTGHGISPAHRREHLSRQSFPNGRGGRNNQKTKAI